RHPLSFPTRRSSDLSSSSPASTSIGLANSSTPWRSGVAVTWTASRVSGRPCACVSSLASSCSPESLAATARAGRAMARAAARADTGKANGPERKRRGGMVGSVTIAVGDWNVILFQFQGNPPFVMTASAKPHRFRLPPWADRLGAFGAFLCAAHCALIPLALALLPAMGLGFLARPGPALAGQPVPAAARCGGCACGDDDPRRRPGRPGPPGQPAPVLGPQPLNAGARPLAGNGPGGRLRAPRITTFKEPTWAGAT